MSFVSAAYPIAAHKTLQIKMMQFRTQYTAVTQLLPDYLRAKPTYKDLKSVEKERRDVLKEDKKFIGWHFLYAFQGTVLPGVLSTGMFWIAMFCYLAIRNARVQYLADVPVLQVAAIAIIGGFMSFFLTLFVNQNYTRFYTMYTNSMTIESKINLMLICRNHMSTEDVWRFMRYINTAHMLGYVGLSPTYTVDNFVHPINEEQNLLLPAAAHFRPDILHHIN